MGDIIARGMAKNKIKITTFTAPSDNVSVIPCNLKYDSIRDDLMVFYNGVLLEEGVNYNVNSGQITLIGWAIKHGEVIYFKLYKDVR